jgi:phosphotransferase system HPr-like phosphotransfer protein
MRYRSVIIYISMILDFNELVNGSSLSLPAHGRGGARATSFLAALFAKQKTKFGGGKARVGKNSFPPTPFLFARPSEFFQKSASGFSRKKVRILSKSPSQ